MDLSDRILQQIIRFRTILRRGNFLTGVFVICLLLCGMPVRASEETQQELDRAKEAVSQTQNEIDANQDTLDSLGDQQDSLSGQLDELNSRLSGLSDRLASLKAESAGKQKEISGKETEIENKQAEIDETSRLILEAQNELDEAVAAEESQYDSMKKQCQLMYEKGQTYYIEILLTSESFGEFLNRRSYIAALNEYNSRQMESYKKLAAEVISRKKELEEQQSELQKEQEEMKAAQAELASQQAELLSLQEDAAGAADEVSRLVTQTAVSLDTTNSQISSAEEAAASLQSQLDSQNAEVSALQKKLEEEKALQAQSDASAWRDLSQVGVDEGDEYLLANLIYCEAGGEPYEGQVAVGAVVMNRVMSGAFPNTISGVIYQKNQFEPALTGRLALALSRDDATQSCYQAAEAAMAGESPVGNCLFFRTPIPEITPKYRIGGHIFY